LSGTHFLNFAEGDSLASFTMPLISCLYDEKAASRAFTVWAPDSPAGYDGVTNIFNVY